MIGNAYHIDFTPFPYMNVVFTW